MNITEPADSPFAQPSATTGKSADPESSNAAYSFDGKPDQWKRYRLPHPETGRASGWTRMTTFAKSISDTYTLSAWSQRMVAKGLALRPDLYMAAASTPVENRDELNRVAEQAKEAAGAKIGANLGTALHSFTEMVDRGESPAIPPPYQPHVAAYRALLEEYDLEVLDIERVVLCLGWDTTGVAGTLDRVVRFRSPKTIATANGEYVIPAGTVMILDLKTAKDLEYGWMEIAVQLAGYANAQHRWDKDSLQWLPQHEGMDTTVALVVHLPATAPGATVTASMYAVDIAAGREIAELCTAVRQARKRKGLATKLTVVREQPVAAVVGPETMALPTGTKAITAPAEPTWAERVAVAKTADDLNAIWMDALVQREANGALADTISTRHRQILADVAAG